MVHSKGTKMKFERERMVPWIVQKVNSDEVPGLRWLDKEKTKFRVTWKHAGKPDFDLERDAVLFRMWAEHTGKYKPGEQPDPSTWKTRFRCALRKMPDIEEIRVPHSLDEREPYRVFRLKSKALKPQPKTRTSTTSLIDTPLPSPKNDKTEGLSSLSSFPVHVTQDQYVEQPSFDHMAYNSDVDVFAFPSPNSSHTSSPTHSYDVNKNSNVFSDDEDNIANINPTLPPLSSQPLPYQHNDFRMLNGLCGNGFSDTDTSSDFHPMINESCSQPETVFTELQRSDGNGYGGRDSGAGMYNGMAPYNSMTNDSISSQCSAFTAQNNDGFYNTSFQMSLFLKMLHAAAESMKTEGLHFELTENTVPVENAMNNGLQRLTGEMEQVPINPSSSLPEKMVVHNMSKLENTEHSLFARVFYDKKEVTTFDLGKDKSSWRLFYGRQDIPSEEIVAAVNYQLYGTYKIKQIQLPEIPCSSDTQRILTNFNRGLMLEMSHDGDIWVTRKCLTKVFHSCGLNQATKLMRDVKTKVFDYSQFQHILRESQKGNCLSPAYDVTFTLGWPNGLLVCIVITHAEAKKMLLDKQNGERCTSEAACFDPSTINLTGQIVLNGGMRFLQDCT